MGRGVGSLAEQLLAKHLQDWWLAQRPLWVDPGWYSASLTAQARALLELEPGAELVAALSAVEPGACPAGHAGEGFPNRPEIGSTPGFLCECQLVVAAGWEACSSWLQARATTQLVDVMGADQIVVPAAGAAPGVADPAREELALVLRVSDRSVVNRLGSARNLVTHPELMELVADGGLAFWTARFLLTDLAHLSVEKQHEISAYLASRIRDRIQAGLVPWTSSQIRQVSKRAMLRMAPDEQKQAKEFGYQDRAVEVFGHGNGMATLEAIMAETDAHRIRNRLTSQAKQLDDPNRNLDQTRADILVDTLLQPDRMPSDTTELHVAPAVAGVEIQVIVKLETLLGLNDDSAEVPGLGPIPADVARELAADGKWRAWITNTSGTVIAALADIRSKTRSYTPSAGLARLIRAREPYCRMPGCQRPAAGCDLDHVVPWPNGPTSAANLGPLCRRHHILKTHYGWQLRVEPDVASMGVRGESNVASAGAGGESVADPVGLEVGRESDPDPVGFHAEHQSESRDSKVDPRPESSDGRVEPSDQLAPRWSWITPTGKRVPSDGWSSTGSADSGPFPF